MQGNSNIKLNSRINTFPRGITSPAISNVTAQNMDLIGVFQCLATLRNVFRICNRLVKVKLSL